MTTVTSHISISLDGFVAGPDQSLDNPIGVGGSRVHDWMFRTATLSGEGERTVDDDEVDAIVAGNGAFIMGRNMFGPGRGEWDEEWRGWWGDNPPYHAPVFVLTSHPREPLTMAGGTTFTFVTDGVESALAQAEAVAGGKNIAVAGGARTIQQYIRAGLLDELNLHVAPVILGAGERLLENVGEPVLKQTKVVASANVTHLTYRIAR
jgi:dihydrofolate reductase